MRKIKTLLLVLTTVAASIIVVAGEPQKKEAAKPIELTKALFLEKVFDSCTACFFQPNQAGETAFS